MGCLFQINFEVIMIVALGNENRLNVFNSDKQTPFWYTERINTGHINS